jgi:hypothetical protein
VRTFGAVPAKVANRRCSGNAFRSSRRAGASKCCALLGDKKVAGELITSGSTSGANLST